MSTLKWLGQVAVVFVCIAFGIIGVCILSSGVKP